MVTWQDVTGIWAGWTAVSKRNTTRTPYPGGCHALVLTGWRASGFRPAWTIPSRQLWPWQALPRQGIDRLDTAKHNKFWLAAHVESTRREMQEGRGLEILCSSTGSRRIRVPPLFEATRIDYPVSFQLGPAD